MNSEQVVELIFLLLLANGTPIVVKKLFGNRFATPVDFGKTFIDGRAWFGKSKTLRGLISSVLVTAPIATMMGYTLQMGILFPLSSLLGDLVSSFIKRRIGLSSGSRAFLLDQLPESVLPLLVCWQILEIDILAMSVIVIGFILSEYILSVVLFRLKIRDHPY